MDLPISPEGCTIMVWPREGEGIPVHVMYQEALLRRAELIHSGGFPGRESGDAFCLHGSVGREHYLAEIMDHRARTF